MKIERLILPICMAALASLSLNCSAPAQTPTESTPIETSDKKAATEQNKATVAPGPLESERKKLYAEIQEASTRGVGISSYMNAFNAIEESVKAGQSAESVSAQVKKLSGALNAQKPKSTINEETAANLVIGEMVRHSLKNSFKGGLKNAKTPEEAAFLKGIMEGIDEAADARAAALLGGKPKVIKKPGQVIHPNGSKK
jgi:hypothetical protein